jgi:DNA-binding NarL/FixJ family response regulator
MPFPSNRPRPHVVVVDDDPGTRKLLRSVLESEDVTVVGTAAGGEEALAIVERFEPDVVLMDLRMPRMSGIEATRRIRELDPRVSVVILTVYEDAELEEGAEEAGVFCYLVKGCPPSMIRKVIVQAWAHGQRPTGTTSG